MEQMLHKRLIDVQCDTFDDIFVNMTLNIRILKISS